MTIRPDRAPSIPLKLAQAYAGGAAVRAGVPAAPRPASPTLDAVSLSGVRRPPVQQAAVAALRQDPQAVASQRATIVDRLSAARVGGVATFESPQPSPGATPPASPAAPLPASLPLYRHPAQKNEIATAVLLGRSLDTQG